MTFNEFVEDFGVLLIMVVLFVIVFIIPNWKQQKQKRKMIDNLQKGDIIITLGGIFGEIITLKQEYMVINVIDTNVNITLVRSAVKKVVDLDKRPE